MAREGLVAALREEAEAEVAGVLAEARARAAALTAAGAERLARRRAEVLAARDADHHAAVERALSDARHAARRLVLEARSRLLDQVFAAARVRFEEAQASAAYQATLAGQVADVLACLGERATTLRSHPGLAAQLQRIVAGRRQIEVQADPAVGWGFVAVADDGSVEVDATLEGRLARSAPRLKLEVLRRLEGGT